MKPMPLNAKFRAKEMPPGLRREFLALAANWRKLADLIDAADGKQDGTEPQGT